MSFIAFGNTIQKKSTSNVLGEETHLSPTPQVSKGLKLAYFMPPPTYLHIIHDMGNHFFDYGLNSNDINAPIGQEDYKWIAKAFNTAVIGYPGPGINDIPTKATIMAAVDHHVWVIVAGGNYDYIAQKIEESPYRDGIIGYRIYDEFVPPNCEKRRYPDTYPGLGPPCSVEEFITEGRSLLTDIATKIKKYSDVPLIVDFIPVELTYSADNPIVWAVNRPGNSNIALTGYLASCTIDHLLLALGGDDSAKGGKTIAQKVEQAKTLWSTIQCADGSGGFDTDHFDQTANGQEIIDLVKNLATQAVQGGANSVDLYPWRHSTGAIDRKTLDLIVCTDNPDSNCKTGGFNSYYESLVDTFQSVTSHVSTQGTVTTNQGEEELKPFSIELFGLKLW